jgi:hypothetical protein
MKKARATNKGMKHLKIKTDTSLNGMGSDIYDYRNDKHPHDQSADEISWMSGEKGHDVHVYKKGLLSVS